jgi:hypothetical protein
MATFKLIVILEHSGRRSGTPPEHRNDDRRIVEQVSWPGKHLESAPPDILSYTEFGHETEPENRNQGLTDAVSKIETLIKSPSKVFEHLHKRKRKR